jgi:hypothetical protein
MRRDFNANGVAMPTSARHLSKHPIAPDFLIIAQGTLFTVLPTNDEARKHREDNASDEPLWWSGALVVEHRFIADLCTALSHEGFTLEAN